MRIIVKKKKKKVAYGAPASSFGCRVQNYTHEIDTVEREKEKERERERGREGERERGKKGVNPRTIYCHI